MAVSHDDLVERRQQYIQRQIALDKSAVNVAFTGQQPEGSGPRNRHGMPQLPVGQHEVKNWPVLDLGEQPDDPARRWTLEIAGLVGQSVHADVGAVSRAAAGRRRQRLSLRHDLEPLRQPLARRAVQHDRRARGARRRGAVHPLHRLRRHAGLAHSLHRQRPARARDRRRRAAGAHVGGHSRCRASTAGRAA